MLKVLQDWFRRYFSDEQAVYLLLALVGGLLVVMFLGRMLAPVFAALVVAYLMQGMINSMVAVGVPRRLSFITVYCCFVALLLLSLVVLLPMLWKQFLTLVQVQFPKLLYAAEDWLRALPERYPETLNAEQISELIGGARHQMTEFGQSVVASSLGLLPGLLDVMIFLVLLPMLVFFFLKDRQQLIAGALAMLPPRRHVLSRVWGEMDDQIANYIRGKALEIIVVGVAAYVAFILLDLRYALLLAVLVGLSVVVPYVGATVVTLPVMVVAWGQFGWGSEFAVVMLVYGVIQFLDGNVLVPLLFSEAVNLHPVVIITAILFFGGLWGFWGVFFAIPLATLSKAVMNAWPSVRVPQPDQSAAPETASPES